MDKIDVAGLKIDSITKQDLLATIHRRIKAGQKTFLSTPYSEFLYRALCDNKIFEVLNKADFAVPDGIGIFWAKKFLDIPLTAKSYWGKILQAYFQAKYSLAAIIFNRRWIMSAFPEKIPGSELVWDIAKLAADNNFSIYLLGGFGNTPKMVANQLISKSVNQLRIAGWSNKNPDDPTTIDDIKKSNADVLLVAYGPIKQEKWIADHLSELPVKLAVGLGGTFDYIAGNKLSPPRFIRTIGLEWLYRLFTQPKRIKRIWQATFGLANKLVHYKVFHSLPLRKNAAIIILNKQNQVLICQRDPTNFYIDIITTEETLKRKNYWQFPQGGIDSGENIVEAAKREAKEETGIKNLEFIKLSQKTHTYIWNNALRRFWHNRHHRNIGQQQNIAYLKFTGPDTEIKIDHHEFIGFKWVEISELENSVNEERQKLAKIVTDDLIEMAENAII